MSAHATVLVVAHGSRAAGTAEAHAELCRQLGQRLGLTAAPAFLEISDPDIPTAIDQAVAAGADTVLLVPHFLHTGNHVLRDIPRYIDEAQRRHPGVRLQMGSHLGGDDRLVGILADRARELIERAESPAPAAER